jgi:hypothetical protein
MEKKATTSFDLSKGSHQVAFNALHSLNQELWELKENSIRAIACKPRPNPLKVAQSTIPDFAHFYICDRGHHSMMFAANRINKYPTVRFLWPSSWKRPNGPVGKTDFLRGLYLRQTMIDRAETFSRCSTLLSLLARTDSTRLTSSLVSCGGSNCAQNHHFPSILSILS